MDKTVDQLVDQARNGDEHALMQLFQSHRDRLARMVHLRMDRRVQARVSESDVLQEAYLDLAQQLPNYAKQPDLPFFLWLRRITGQRLAKVHRLHLGQAKRAVGREVSYGESPVTEASSIYLAADLVDQMTSPSGRMVREEALAKVQEAIDTLADPDREIIALRHGELMSNEEIALLIGISSKAASMRYTRAILRLKDALDDASGILD